MPNTIDMVAADMESFKDKCARLGVDYHRALKRRQANLPEDRIFDKGYIRNSRVTNEVVVNGKTFPNLKEAVRDLNPVASRKTISRLLQKGVSPEEAFAYVPNPGYANGIVYCVTHKASLKKYIGLTMQTIERRWQYHLEQASAGYIKSSQSLHAAIRKHGADAFEVKQIDRGVTKKGLEEKERAWIQRLNTISPNGFNISAGGVSGGSNKKPTVVDGVRYESVFEAANNLAESKGISVAAAKKRISVNRTNIKKPAKPGESLVKTKSYKTWSRIVHGALNPKSRDYIPKLDIYKPWLVFDNFYKDVGTPPKEKMSFIRLDKDRGFFPNNCSWVSRSEASQINAANMKKKGTLTGRKKKKTRKAN